MTRLFRQKLFKLERTSSSLISLVQTVWKEVVLLFSQQLLSRFRKFEQSRLRHVSYEHIFFLLSARTASLFCS
jgi:hypothetical protein